MSPKRTWRFANTLMTTLCTCLMHVWQRPCFNQLLKLLLNLINLLTSLWQCLHETNCEHIQYCFSSVSQGFIYYLRNALRYLDNNERLLQTWHNWCKAECWDVFDYFTWKGRESISRAFSCCESGLEYQDEWFWIYIFFLIPLAFHRFVYRFWMMNTSLQH